MRTPEIIPPFFRREEESNPQKEFSRLTHELTGFLRLWDAMEGRERDVIDFDLVREEPIYQAFEEYIIGAPTKEERKRILARLEEFQEKVEGLSQSRVDVEVHQIEFLRAKIQAHIAYCQRKLGVEFNPMEYIEKTMGVKPEIIPNEILLIQKERVMGLFEKLGCLKYTKGEIEKFRAERILPENSITGYLSHNSDVSLRALSDFLGRKIAPKFGIEAVKKEGYWVNWSNGTRNKFKLRVNLHPRHAWRWTKGKVEEMPIHEIAGHFGQMSGWQNAIDKKELIPVLGLTSVHDPAQITTEGIAQTLPYFVPGIEEQLCDDGRLEFEISGLRMMIYNNIHIWVNSAPVTQETEEKMIKYMHKFFPIEPEEEIRKQIKDRSMNPLLQTYLYSYGIGNYRHRLYAQALNLDGKRKLLDLIYSQPITPEQEERFVSKLLTDHRGRYSAQKVSNGELTGVHH